MPLILLAISFLFALRGNYYTAPPSSGAPGYALCEPNLEINNWIRIDVFPEKETLQSGAPLYKDKENKLWVLIKRNAPIPAWKVWGGQTKTREGERLGEMEKMGTVLSSSETSYLGKEVFVGLGHCDGDPGKDCADPLVQDSLFVPVVEGAKPPNLPPCMTRWPDAKSKACQKEPGYWWEFNVYLDATPLPPNPSNQDLPCWAKLACGKGDVMGEKRKQVWEEYLKTGVCKAGEVLGAQTTLPSFVLKNGINFTNPAFEQNKLAEVYWYEQEITSNPVDLGALEIGSYTQGGTFILYYLESGGVLFLSDGGKFYSYLEIVETIRPNAKSLQLGTFNPQRGFAYEWWTPACKPAIYLYPQEPTELTVKVKPVGRLTQSIPEHGEEGWKVIAYPDGSLKPVASYQTPATSYPYLYYEAELEKVKVPEDGWIIDKEDLKDFFASLLPQLGLNQKEQGDFLAYWLPKLSEGETWFIGLIEREELDRVEPIEFSSPKQPDAFIRVRFYFEKITDRTIERNYDIKKNKNIAISKYRNIEPRRGFVAVDWGGILANGSCGIGEKSQ